MDQDRLPGFEPAGVEQRLPGREGRQRDGGGLSKGQVGRHRCHRGCRHGHVLGIGSPLHDRLAAIGEDFVADSEAGDRRSRIGHGAGHVPAGNQRKTMGEEPCEHAFADLPVDGIDTRVDHSDQNLVGLGFRSRNLGQLQPIGARRSG
jgi:hypothetical protein